ncbi:MAG: HEAT repeat domain-containing protein, partial [Pirellula sp.]
LKLMHTIDPVFAREMVKESLVGGSPDVKVAAIECLGSDADDLSYLIEQSKASAKNVRQAAYHSLCKVAKEESLAILIKALAQKVPGLRFHLVTNNRNQLKDPSNLITLFFLIAVRWDFDEEFSSPIQSGIDKLG